MESVDITMIICFPFSPLAKYHFSTIFILRQVRLLLSNF